MVKVQLRDGTILKCNIYEKDERGQLPIVDHDKIHSLFINKGFVNFQTETINGKFHSGSVINYVIEDEI